MNTQPKPFTYTVQGAQAASGLGQTTLYALISRGVLVARKAGRRTLIEAEGLHRYLASLPPAEIRHSGKAA